MDQLKDALGFDPEKLSKDADTFFARLRDMHQAGTEITARAESADRRVAVEYSSAERDAIGRELRNATGAVHQNLANATETLDKLQDLLRR